jgi:hypothetical protein
MHPELARALVEGLSHPGERVLDPFCGSGTVLVEAMAAGRRALGVDLNPLAARLAGFKARPWQPERAEAIARGARAVAERAPRTRHAAPAGEQPFFEPHVLPELGRLRGEILRLPPGEAREGLELVLSAILVKLSRQASDTRRELVRKQLAPGFATRLFVRKAEELVARLCELAARLPQGATAAEVHAGDARRLHGIGASTVALVITSPPYGGAFDYVAHHERRARWLGLDLSPLRRGEIGARRARADRRAFSEDTVAWLRASARCLRPGGRAAVVTGDELVSERASAAGLRFVAAASQPRPQARQEHLILLEKPIR